MKPQEVDMSPEGITRRLQEVGDLWDLWQKIRTAKDLGPVESPRRKSRTTSAGRKRPAATRSTRNVKHIPRVAKERN